MFIYNCVILIIILYHILMYLSCSLRYSQELKLNVALKPVLRQFSFLYFIYLFKLIIIINRQFNYYPKLPFSGTLMD